MAAKTLVAVAAIYLVLGGTAVAQASNPIGSPKMNRSGAVFYADNWWNARNPQFPNWFSSDCTNFISQVWANGGNIPQVRSYADILLYGAWNADSYSATPTWSVVEDFRNYWVTKRKLAVMYQQDLSFRMSSGTQRGDGIALHWDPYISGFHHLMVYIGYGAYNSTRDNPYHDLWSVVDQHTNDRYHSPWNFVWLNEPDITKRNQMFGYSISYNDNGV